MVPLYPTNGISSATFGVAGLLKYIPMIGSARATDGNIWIQDDYGTGHLVTIGQCFGSGFFFIGYGVTIVGDNYYSTTPINIPRAIYKFTASGIIAGYAEICAVGIGEPINLVFK